MANGARAFVVDPGMHAMQRVLEIGETPPEDTNFLDYYDQAVSALEAVKA